MSLLWNPASKLLIIHLSSANVPKGVLNVYWNQGGKAIDDFFEEHRSACKENWICKRLKLRDEPSIDLSHGGSPGTSKSAKGHQLSFVLEDPHLVL